MSRVKIQLWLLVVIGSATALLSGCSGAGDAPASGAGALQSQCVINQLDLVRNVADGNSCSNFGYSDCTGFGSECINYCAFGFCQPGECASPDDCVAAFGAAPVGLAWLCKDYVVSNKSYGKWCESVTGCPEGTVNCPCLPGDLCGPDPWGDGNMSCVGGFCESQCPSSCIVGSVCCGGTLCAGNCIGTPCCS